MMYEEFLKKLDENNLSYILYDKWSIINHHSNIDLSYEFINIFPGYIIFNNKSVVNLNNNYFLYLPKNIIFSKNVTKILITNGNSNLKLKYYGNYFSKIINLYTYRLNDNLLFEKLINMYCSINSIYKQLETPHLCFKKILDYPDNKIYVYIKLPKSFLSISSWI